MIAEDSAALLGLLIAALGIWAGHAFDMPELDGVASMLIGILLAAVAVLLMRESRGLVIGEGVRRDTTRHIRAMVAAEPSVRQVAMPLSMYIGPDEVLLTIDVEFDPTINAGELVKSIELRIRERFPRMRRIYIEPREKLDFERLPA